MESDRPQAVGTLPLSASSGTGAAMSALQCSMRGFSILAFFRLFAFLSVVGFAGQSFACPPKMLHETPANSCTLMDGAYHCNLAAFQRTLASAHEVSIQTQPMDRLAAAQLRRLVASLGKQLGTNDRPATLLIALTPVEMMGVTFGPGDHDLATLRVYTVDRESRRGDLLWAETLRGQGDRPWPAQVHALIEQFQTRLKQQ